MKAKLTENGEKVVDELQIPIGARDAFNLVMLPKKIESKEVQELKIKIVRLLQKDKFYEAMIKLTEAIETIENDKKELIMRERGMEIKIV